MSRIYLRDPSLAPKDAHIYHGPDGGVWYNSEEREIDQDDGHDDQDHAPPQSNAEDSKNTRQTGPNSGGSGDSPGQSSPGGPEPVPPAEYRVWVFSDSVSVAISFVGGRLQIIHSGSAESTEVARDITRRALASGGAPESFMSIALEVADEKCLNTSQL